MKTLSILLVGAGLFFGSFAGSETAMMPEAEREQVSWPSGSMPKDENDKPRSDAAAGALDKASTKEVEELPVGISTPLSEECNKKPTKEEQDKCLMDITKSNVK